MSAHMTLAAHNVARHSLVDGYQPDDLLVPVFAGSVWADSERDACDVVYRLLNIGDDPNFGKPDGRAVAYRRAGNRSLSIGDAVRVNGQWFVCRAIGWVRVQDVALLWGVRVPGSTGLDGSGVVAHE